MFLRLVTTSLIRRPRRTLLIILTLALGSAGGSALLSLFLNAGDRLAEELRGFGPNLRIIPKATSLPLTAGGYDIAAPEECARINTKTLINLKSIFWKHHIKAFAPFLSLPVQLEGKQQVVAVGTWFQHLLNTEDGPFLTGLLYLYPRWKLQGTLPEEGQKTCLLGQRLAEQLRLKRGDLLLLHYKGQKEELKVTGLLQTGGPEEEQLWVPLNLLQKMAHLPDKAEEVLVSALTVPETGLALKDIRKMTPEEYERWYCTPYISSIARQITEALPGVEALPILKASQTEGAVLLRMKSLWLLLAGVALISALLGVFAALSASALERRSEVALLRALGADHQQIRLLFTAEALLLGLGGGIIGFGAGHLLANTLSLLTWSHSLPLQPFSFASALLFGIITALLASLGPVNLILKPAPALLLKEG